jgi:ABC-type transport system involved in cytochrome c biogenesis permease subunit
MKLAKIVPWAAGALSVTLVAAFLMPPHRVRVATPTGAQAFDLAAFGRLPVLEGGRVKPIDSVARNALLMIRNKSGFSGEVPADGGGTVKASFPATQWLLDVLFRPERAERYPAFVVDDPDLLGLLRIEQRGGRTYASYAEMSPRFGDVQKQAMITATDADGRRLQRAANNLYGRAVLHYRLERTLQLPGLTMDQVLADGKTALRNVEELDQTAQFRPIPPAAGARPEEWHTVGRGLALVATGSAADRPFLTGWSEIGRAWVAQDAKAFNAAVSSLTGLMEAANPGAARQGWMEALFNRAQPFTLGIALYILAMVTVFFSWLGWPQAFRRGAFVFLVAGVVVHTIGIVARVKLQGYPPVTNLYSSAVGVGWVAVVVAVILEARFRRGFGTLVAGTIGAGTLIIAQNLTTSGDTMEMMRAVLDSNFWLTTHVLAIIIGYGGTFLAGFIAIVATLYRHLAPRRDPGDDKVLATMTYGVVCFALFFSFVGTVLGGIWADQSWGRFWGWDPKENGALLIVLWNAIILHARWGGYARERGIAAMAIFGNVITSLSWFGVNMLGVGLHSYGFMDQAFVALSIFIASQLLLVALALAPERFWNASAWRRGQPKAT